MSEMERNNQMDTKQEKAALPLALAKSRADMYRFLSRLYLLEVDEQMFESMAGMQFPKEGPQEDLAEGYELMQDYLTAAKARLEQNQGQPGNAALQEILDELAVDYARIFLSAGVAQGKAAFPYASVYTSRQHLMMQDSRNDAAALFAKNGLAPRKDMYRIPEDHIGLLLEYMALLCDEEAGQPEMAQGGQGAETREQAQAAGSQEQIRGAAEKSGALAKQADFLKNQLLNWATAFTADVVKYASTDFYRGLGKLTKGFLTLEGSLRLER